MEELNKEGEKYNKLLPSHYYFNEKGLLVFTEDYHLSRGHCCGNKCLHCCYLPRHTKGVTNINLEKNKS
jgi:hypothetical protein